MIISLLHSTVFDRGSIRRQPGAEAVLMRSGAPSPRFRGHRIEAQTSQDPSSNSVRGGLHSALGGDMIQWKRAAMLGFLSWAIPFGISLLLFPLKKSNAPMFG